MLNKSNMYYKSYKADKPSVSLAALIVCLLLSPIQLSAQITIGGDVYGGGKEGAVGTGIVSSETTKDTAPESVEFTGNKETVVAEVNINGGKIRTVFGGGRNGRAYGSTSVSVKTAEAEIGGTVDGVDWTGTTHGGLFGAGDGKSAYVFGNSSVTIEAGTVYQNVYGGGNQAELGGHTLVKLQGGDLQGDVFGGARMADIKGYSEVNIDGKNIKNDLVVNYVYGGNDISGSIQGTKAVNDQEVNAYVHSSEEAEGKHIFVGQLFAGGNGDYAYESGGTSLTMVDEPAQGEETPATTFTELSKPVLSKTYLDLKGGTFGYAFGGGNYATITESTYISINNTSTVSTPSLETALTKARLEAMGLNPTNLIKDGWQFNRVFGGNNKAEMNIRPTWNLAKGSVYNLYSGGNKGMMTHENGILVNIQSADMIVENVYGGCRIADVDPSKNQGAGTIEAENFPGDTEHQFQEGYAARVLITAGHINNVYGGNDISGTVYYGTDLEILGSVAGEVYGGGNGSYVYTDNEKLADHADFEDLYYEASGTSVDALNAFRPQTERSYVHVAGTSSTPTVVGKVFGGGNSATVSGTEEGDVHLQLGQYVEIEDVFLGSNGAQMTATETLAKYTSGEEDSEGISKMYLTDKSTMATYMQGAAVACMPVYHFDAEYPSTNDGTLAHVGSFYGGGNVGSMTSTELFDIAFSKPIIFTKKLVGGCNAATVPAAYGINAENVGGFIGTSGEKIHINVDGIIFDVDPAPASLEAVGAGNQGNVFGGCFQSGIVKGNVEIKIQNDIVPETFFASGNPTRESYLDYSVAENAANLFATPLSVFGGGYGKEATVEGNTTLDFSVEGGALKAFGGGYGGKVVGYTTINFTGDSNVGKLYGGGFEGPITGNATVNLDGGTAYDVIGGACNADVGGHTEVYVGVNGFPTITNNIYGANDFGGKIEGTGSFATQVTESATDKVYNNTLLSAGAYVEYIKGKVNYIFGGAKAAYNYKDQTLYSEYADEDGKAKEPFEKTFVKNAFVNFRPEYYTGSSVARVYGAGQGYFNERDKDLLQSNSYVLIDVPADVDNFARLEVFGAGDYSGVGMDIKANDVREAEAAKADDVTAAAVIDLVRGNINSVYGGSYKQGFTRRTIVNVPVGSTIDMNYLYGGAYGVAAADGNTLGNLYPCDVYESNVNYNSGDARVRTIYGGNNSYRRTLYSHINIHTPVRYVHQTYGLTHANVFGAGYGENTWAQYTEINLFDGAMVYEPYGGGEAGSVYNKETIASLAETNGWSLAMPGDYDADGDDGLDNALAHSNQLYTDYHGNTTVNVAEKYNTNVHIHKGATVVNYAYGAGLGSHIYTYQFDGNGEGNTEPQPSDYMASATTADDLDAEARAKYDAALAAYTTYSGYTSSSTVGAYEYNSFNSDQKKHWTQTNHRTTAVVSGTSYIDLLGGTVLKDLYAAGTTGSVQDTLSIKSFVASSTAYIKGGTVRNVYGGGWEGPVGKHDLSKTGDDLSEDVLGVANVIIGRPEKDIEVAYKADASHSLTKEEFYFYNGVPAITRNAYAGGEGGVVRGTANLDIFNGLIGYRFKKKDAITEAEKNCYKVETKEDGSITYVALMTDKLDESETNLYVEEVDQDAVGDNILYEAGNAFGGGYAANSDVDVANVTLWDGIIRNSMYGGGEIATIGRGMQTKNSSNEFDVTIYKPGETHVTMWGGHVLRDVFGGGRGFNNWKTEDKEEGNTNGYVFGQTDVNIHMGTIGTPDGVSKGYGNVFGGGNIGFVYSQYQKNKRDGWYYTTSDVPQLSEDTRVEVKVYGKALEDVTIGGTKYSKRDYIPNTELDKLTNNDSDKALWAKVDQSGVTIYNAVFAGGNVSAGSDKIMAFSKTVYGNSTASIVDIYNRDLVSVGGSGVGGIYGDGNLTFVDGYRELNITNYGTDYFYLGGGVSSEAEYEALTPRQQSFYMTQYECSSPYESYEKNDVIMSDVYNSMTAEQKAHWTRKHSMVNEGRYINTVQRCDFCGIKGSRLVLHGAIDRAQDEAEADFTNYTINRVGELSLNQNHQAGQDSHGSYFGIYNVVKFLGSVTSDVHFSAVRQTKSGGEYTANGKTTYYEWKQDHKGDNMRNDGTAPNKIALASGVFLELVKELDTNGDKVYGPITGVVELDLLNVSPGEGGGYVYAKNIHGTPSYSAQFADVISDANKGLVTNRAFTYAEAGADDQMQTSGNFIHSLPKRILDDCFPMSKSFAGADASPAHYWYIRGEFYVYEQLVSAYTGAADSYSTELSIPLTMAIQGNAKLRLLNVVPGLYADPKLLTHYTYNADDPELSVSDSLSIVKAVPDSGNSSAVIKSYGQGDPISYWDWYNATTAERKMFVVETDAMVCHTEVTIAGRTYYPGETISREAYEALAGGTAYDSEGLPIVETSGGISTAVNPQTFFSVINEVSHDNGYLLTLDFSNPSKWDDYYRLFADKDAAAVTKAELQKKLEDGTAQLEDYVKSATFTCKESGTYGQYYFYADEVISRNVFDMQTEAVENGSSQTQAKFVPAYIAMKDCEVRDGDKQKSFTQGTPISEKEYEAITDNSTYFEPAYICVNTVLVANGDYRVLNQLVGKSEYDAWTDPSVKSSFQQAYYCTSEGSWGGKFYEEGKSYNGVDFGQLLPKERKHFSYNYDALDALLYSNYSETGSAYTYKDYQNYTDFINNIGGANRNHPAVSVFDKADNPFYAVSAPLDYLATFNSTNGEDEFTYVKDGANLEVKIGGTGETLNNVQYESLPNDRKYYASFGVSDDHLKDKDGEDWSDGNFHTFIVKETFDVAGEMFNTGKSITHKQYSSLGEQLQQKVEEVIIPKEKGADTYYYCIEEYTAGADDVNIKTTSGTHNTPNIKDITGGEHDKGTVVPAGTIIDKTYMAAIPNYQLNFTIHGETPVEETTLYVPVSADIDALQKDRYVTAIYEYTYTESDATGMNYETRVEKHIINIRIKFLSGTPIIGSLREPDIVLPLETVGLDIPSIQEGAFPILGGGWEIYPSEDNAKHHRNGKDYVNGGEQLYFYQDDYYVAYYALTRMGKTFSEPVPLHVANYQRMADVISNPNHMFINHRDNARNPKIYIDGRASDTNGGNITFVDSHGVTRTYANELDAMQGMWDIVNNEAYGKAYSAEVNGKQRDITGAGALDFILQGEVRSELPTWTSLGDNEHCFQGTFHGNGNAVTGLNNSLFGHLCGRVYNLGVTGSFTAGGVADTGEGRIENAWVWTSGAPNGQPVYANPAADAVVINTYYPDANSGFTVSGGNEKVEIKERPVDDFVNGSVAYDLNRYYLEARYRWFAGKEGAVVDSLFYRLPDGNVQKNMLAQINDANGKKPGATGYVPTYANLSYPISYDADYAIYSKWNTAEGSLGYVEKYYEDGDFRYADGLKPLKIDMRLSQRNNYLPIYPDDYIFFGQKLTYGLFNGTSGTPIAHDWHPVAAAKSRTTSSGEVVDNSKSGLLINDITNINENRVYRAPAYFRNGEYGSSVMFNANAAFADTYDYTVGGISYTAHPHRDLTAVDFTGGNGDTRGYQGVVAGLPADFTDKATDNYKPLLDFERLDGIRTSAGITQNLLAYAPKPDVEGTKNTQANNVLVSYFRDPAYAETDADSYRRVAVQDATNIKGHAVVQTSTERTSDKDYTYESVSDHFLVDRQDFNAPISYAMADGKRMWYQREPDNFVDRSAGWEGISLPFSAELVTTQDKGEITHFYAGSTYGHEYWLRGFAEGGTTDGNVYQANFCYPEAGSADKQYKNTFLWDYYYRELSDIRQDANTDEYQRQYYAAPQTFSSYGYSEADQPYIVGFPGKTYYEFDLSGSFKPANTLHDVETLDAQVITFASDKGASIAKSDKAIDDAISANTYDGYAFTPSYLNTTVEADAAYVLNAAGSSFDLAAAPATVAAFRPYFTAASSEAKGYKGAKPRSRTITWSMASTTIGSEEETEPAQSIAGNLIISSRQSRILVQSTLAEKVAVRIYDTAGALVSTFAINPGEIVETPVARGIYIVNRKKVTVR